MRAQQRRIAAGRGGLPPPAPEGDWPMNSPRARTLALITVGAVAIGCFSESCGVLPSDGRSGKSYVSADGKSRITSVRAGYAKRGDTRLLRGPVRDDPVQALTLSKGKLAESDTLLLIFDTEGEVKVDHTSTLVAQDGSEYALLGMSTLKPAASNAQADMVPNEEHSVYFLLGSSEAAGGAAILAYQLPRGPSRLTVKGLEGFAGVRIDLN
jgi:hypothetical protein